MESFDDAAEVEVEAPPSLSHDFDGPDSMIAVLEEELREMGKDLELDKIASTNVGGGGGGGEGSSSVDEASSASSSSSSAATASSSSSAAEIAQLHNELKKDSAIISMLKMQLLQKTEELERHKKDASAAAAEQTAKESLSQDEQQQEIAHLRQKLDAISLTSNEIALTSNARVAELEAQLAAAQEMNHSNMESFEQMQASLTALLQEKEHLAVELKLKEEANLRALSKIQVLTEEKQLNRKMIKELNEGLEQQLQHVFTENAKIEELEASVVQLQQEKDRLNASALARTKQVDSLTAICDDQKQQLETVKKRREGVFILFFFF